MRPVTALLVAAAVTTGCTSETPRAQEAEVTLADAISDRLAETGGRRRGCEPPHPGSPADTRSH